jgi:chemotaxis protein MotA
VDIATLIGFALAIGAPMVTIMLEGGSPLAYAQLSAFIMIFGGTMAAVFINFPLGTIMLLPKLIMKALFATPHDPADTIEQIVKMVERARQQGLLSLEAVAQELHDPFLKKGVMMVVDGFQPELVRTVLENEIAALEARHKPGAAMIEAAGAYSPTMGIIGTVLGLVTVLSHLENPSELGHMIATAFIATLYGIFFANLLWLPIAGKLKLRSREEVEARELVLEGLAALQAGENPRVVRQKLEAFLAPAAKARAEQAAQAAPVGSAATEAA